MSCDVLRLVGALPIPTPHPPPPGQELLKSSLGYEEHGAGATAHGIIGEAAMRLEDALLLLHGAGGSSSSPGPGAAEGRPAQPMPTPLSFGSLPDDTGAARAALLGLPPAALVALGREGLLGLEADASRLRNLAAYPPGAGAHEAAGAGRGTCGGPEAAAAEAMARWG